MSFDKYFISKMISLFSKEAQYGNRAQQRTCENWAFGLQMFLASLEKQTVEKLYFCS